MIVCLAVCAAMRPSFEAGKGTSTVSPSWIASFFAMRRACATERMPKPRSLSETA